MIINFTNGVLIINNKKVQTVVFTDQTAMVFPIDVSNEEVSLYSEVGGHIATTKGGGVAISNSKNVITPGSTIITGGSFHLGDK